MDLVLVRHGESRANRDGVVQGRMDFPLSEAGREQALKTSAALVEFRPFRIYSSPLGRALETAQIINRPHNVKVMVLDALIEYDLGGFEGLDWNEIQKRFPDVRTELEKGAPFHWLAPRAETDAEVSARASRALEEILDSGLPRVAVVSHLGILERLIERIVELYPLEKGPRLLKFPLKNCSITRVSINGAASRVTECNNVSHLRGSSP